jgi:hypothetical protein
VQACPLHTTSPFRKHLRSSSFPFSFIKYFPLGFKIPLRHEYRYLHFVYDMKFMLPLCFGSCLQGVYLGSKPARIFQYLYYMEQKHLKNLSHLIVCINYSGYKTLLWYSWANLRVECRRNPLRPILKCIIRPISLRYSPKSQKESQNRWCSTGIRTGYLLSVSHA